MTHTLRHGLLCAFGALSFAAGAALAPVTALAAPVPASAMRASGAAADGHGAALAIDGDATTYWQSPGDSSMRDYRRFVDITFDGTYRIDGVTVKNNPGASYHYEVYLSRDGETFDKVAYKASDAAADADGDTYTFDAAEAVAARVSVGYSSAGQAVNIADISFNGAKVSDKQAVDAPIAVEAFADSAWGQEWNRFESDRDYASKKVVSEARALVGRVLGEKWQDRFVFELRGKKDGKDVFEVSDAPGGKIRVRGNDGVSLASGLNYYLRTYCKVDYNPLFGSNLKMPASLPRVGKTVLKFTDYEYRYALNFCTYSYTMAFWNWDEYEPFLDWCAMNGVNLLLDIVGQEEVLRETLTQYGYTDDEVKEYLCGPAYFAWFYMQNLYSVGGPLPDSWFEQRVELARKIHDRMQTFGIDPVIQGFGGQVPVDFQQKNPDSVAASSGSWSGFDRPFMIKTYLTDEDRAAGKQDYFQKVGTSFYEAQERVFGKVSHFYAVDPFHEGGTVPQGFNIVDIYRTVQQKMLAHDKDAVWVMQQWQWGIDENKLSGLANKEQALVLDLQSDLRSQAGPMEAQHVPWVWNMLHNFGGRMGMDGVPEVLATQIPAAYNSNKYMRGIGITPEAIDNSPVVYELLFDMTWEQDPVDYRAWTRGYVERRYGGTDPKIQKAWDILLDTVYKYRPGEYYQGASESIMNARPSDGPIGAASTWGHSDIKYDKKEFEKAARLFIECYDTYRDSEAFRYDFVDVMRQVLANAFQEYQPLAGEAYRARDAQRYEVLANQMLAMLDAQDKILSTSEDFLLGNWIKDARTLLEGADDWTQDLFELNARALITTWGLNKNGSLIDYSNRQWAGLTGDYYAPRWRAHIDARKKALAEGAQAADVDWFAYGWEWANRKSDEADHGFATKPSNEDPKKLAQKIMDEYSVTAMDKVTGGAEAVKYKNLAAGKQVVDVEANRAVENLTDENTDSGWTNPGKRSATLEVDLGGTYSVKGAGITLQQIAADFPLTYRVEALVDGQWTKVGESTSGTVSSKNEVTCDVLASKVRFTVSSSNDQNLVGIYELSVMGVPSPSAQYKNLSRGARAAAGSTEGGRRLEWGIDGKTDTLWVGNGSDPNWYQVELAQPARVDRARLVFEQPGREFQFKIVAVLPDGTEKVVLDKTGNQSGLEGAYACDMGYAVRAVKVVFTGSVGGTAWPALSELELLQEERESVGGANIAPTATITSSPAKDAPENEAALVDGADTAWVSRDGAKPAWFNLDFPQVQYVETIHLGFEKGQPDRSMQFDLKVTDGEGHERTVLSRSAEDLATPQGIDISVPVGGMVKSVRMDIADARIPSSGEGAWPLVREIEVFAAPKSASAHASVSAGEGSALAQDELDKIKDGNPQTLATLSSKADKTVTLALDKPRDLNALGLVTAAAERPVRFTVEGKVVDPSSPDAAGAWKKLADYSGNTKLSPELVARFAKPVLVSEVRLTFLNNEPVNVAEVYLYEVDGSTGVLSYVDKVEQSISGLTFGEFAGNYRQDAKDALVAVLERVRAAAEAGCNSAEARALLDEVRQAESVFWNTAFVSLDRNDLYVALDRAEAVRAALPEGAAGARGELDAAIAEARRVSDAYGTVTQKMVADAAAALTARVDKVVDALSAAEKLDVLIAAAKDVLKGAVVGEFDGQYPQQAKDALKAAIAAAESAREEHGSDAAALTSAADALKQALDAFDATRVHVDAGKLETALARAETVGEESRYDADAWKKFQGALAEAKKVDVKAVSQEDLDAAAAKLSGAIDKLEVAVLDRAGLSAAIDEARSYAANGYTEASWKKFEDALARAEKALAKTSTTQEDLDAAEADLRAAMDGLDPVAPAPGPDGGDQGAGQGGGQDGNGSGGSGGTQQGGAQHGGGSGNGGGSGSGQPAAPQGSMTQNDQQGAQRPAGPATPGKPGALAQTGDMALAWVAALSGAGAIVCAAAAIVALRRHQA